MFPTQNTRGGRRSKSPEMFLFWCKSCLNNTTRCFMKFMDWTNPVVWAEIQFKFWHWMFTYWATTLYPGPLFTSKHDRSTSFYDQESLDMLKTGLYGTWFSTLFGTPFAEICQGKWAKMEYMANYCSVLPHFCCNNILYWNMTQIGSVGGEIWQIGGERLGSHRGQLDTCNPIGSFQAWVFKATNGYLWALSLETASWGAHPLGTFQKHPLFSPPSTTSVKIRYIHHI